jgi:hypothetical protein
MIDSWSLEHDGFARFSDDYRMRYRLARALTPGALDQGIGTVGDLAPGRRRVVFVMLNPSTADAFKLDPTVRRCCEFARRWGADLLEVVNLFALRSPQPASLREAGSAVAAGATEENDREIVAACQGATHVIAAWGMHGDLYTRADFVTLLLTESCSVKLEILGVSGGERKSMPKHPLARGKHRIADDVMPRVWVR